ncbi:MAG: class I SAM-dependent methyltransferase [Proteobacteria bacterium]|nr:class I SAM-dependent methyltransferase [Pseudomonadota bacterium]
MGDNPCMKISGIKQKYDRLAKSYDLLFSHIFEPGRAQVVDTINARFGNKGDVRVLEVGVGTGLSLAHYNRNLQVTAIDISPKMLEFALDRKAKLALEHIIIKEMNAEHLAFPDHHFDVITALYVISVAENPVKMMQELARTVKPGGSVFIASHFSDGKGIVSFFERLLAPLTHYVGWKSYFKTAEIMIPELKLVSTHKTNIFGYWTILEFQK